LFFRALLLAYQTRDSICVQIRAKQAARCCLVAVKVAVVKQNKISDLLFLVSTFGISLLGQSYPAISSPLRPAKMSLSTVRVNFRENGSTGTEKTVRNYDVSVFSGVMCLFIRPLSCCYYMYTQQAALMFVQFRSFMCSFIRIPSFIHSIHSYILSAIKSVSHSFIQSVSHIHSFVHSFVRSFVRLLAWCTAAVVYLCNQSSIHSFVRSFVRSFIHSFVQSINQSIIPRALSFICWFTHSLFHVFAH